MKKLTVAVMVFMFLAVSTAVFAQAPDGAPTPVTAQKIIQAVMTMFNKFGVAVFGQQKTTSTTQTLVYKEDPNGDTIIDNKRYSLVPGQGSNEESVTTTDLHFIGSSLKADKSVTITTGSTSEGGSTNGNFNQSYTYDTAGRLTGVAGSGSTTTFDGLVTADSEAGGGLTGSTISYTNTTVTYAIKEGEVLQKGTSSTTNTYKAVQAADGTWTSGDYQSTTTGTSTNEYAFINGAYHLTRSTSTSRTEDKNGGYQELTRTTIYNKDANGFTQGVTQTATGSRVDVNPDSNSRTTYTLQNYVSEWQWSESQGWSPAKESYEWMSQDGTIQNVQTNNQTGTTATTTTPPGTTPPSTGGTTGGIDWTQYEPEVRLLADLSGAEATAWATLLKAAGYVLPPGY